MAQPRYACNCCGTWTCAACGWKRPQASTNHREHACGACPSREGTITPTMHTETQWQRHNGYYDNWNAPLPTPYPYGTQAPAEQMTATTGPEFYRGIRVPRSGPYGRTDIPSWKRGVDDCLKHQQKEEEREA